MEITKAEKKLVEASDPEPILSDASDPNGVFDIPLVNPRIGDEYQAEIPPMLTQSQFLELSRNPSESESTTHTAYQSFLMGLPMPITWTCNEANVSKGNHKKIFHNTTCSNHVSSSLSERFKVETASCFIVPGLSPDSWSDFDVESFVLGLYIFGKNLLQVQRFMETKDVGQIQCFYYGTFYKCPRYCKWVDCRKMRNKKCVMGSKIFTGCRQHELLSRLLPHLTEEAKVTFQEISNALVEERMSLEEYVSSLKRMVGIHVLVEAVRIGKGKEDLTTLIADNSKYGQRQRVRPAELPSGKAWSSLTSADIIKYLTSDVRLSKARSNDLFWEAVWPRLLAKGWHSEQPNDICTAPKNSLVFLMPGIKRFSRRKLKHGTHFFDSVSEVLRKVASEPQLLELQEAGPENVKEEKNDCALLDLIDDRKDKDRPCYLKPQAVANEMKFTVVDTSSPSKVRDLRGLPAEEKHLFKLMEDGMHLFGEFSIKSLKNGEVSQKLKTPKPLKPSVASLCADEQVRTMKHHLSRREKPGSSVKRQRLIDRNLTNMGLKQEKPSFVLSLPASTDKNFTFRECSLKGKKSISSPSSSANLSLRDVKVSPQRESESKPRLLLIDLNLPMEPEPDDQLQMIDLENASGRSNNSVKTEAMEEISEEVPNASSRRLSTRTRPLTTKALEALEIDFLSLRQSKKRLSASSIDRKTRLNRQERSDEGSYGEPGSDGIGDGKMDVVTSPLVQNNEAVWPVNC